MELTGGSDEVTVEETPTTEETTVEETPNQEEVQTEEASPEEVSKEEPTLYETPDGRQVTAEVLQKEWKENFLPEFTRKSQKLAEYEREKTISSTPEESKPEWMRDDYIPQNYAEVIELAKAEAVAEMQRAAQAEQQRVADIQKAVESELSEVKALDPKLDENELFQHANKYGFKSLKTAYTNMADMKKTAIDVEQRTVKNLKTRETDPISTGPGTEFTEDSGYDPARMSQFDGAADYLASLKGGK